MKTAVQYLDQAKAITGSDYKTAQILGISRQHLSSIRRGKPLSDDLSYQLAELLKVSPLEIIANQNAERARNGDMRKKWEKLARSIAAVLVLGIGLSAPVDQTLAADRENFDPNFTIISIMRSLFAWLGLLPSVRRCPS